MVAFFLLPAAGAQRLYTYGPALRAGYEPAVQSMPYETPYAPQAVEYVPYDYVTVETEGWGWADLTMPVAAGSLMGFAAAAYSGKSKTRGCGNPDCTCGAACQCGPGCQCGKAGKVSMLGVSGRELTLYEKAKQVALAGLVSLGLFAGAANAVDVKMGSDSGQLVFVPDEVTIKAGDSITWIGNVGMPHNVVFDEDNVPDGADLSKLNHEDMVGEKGDKVTSTFSTKGKYEYYCEPHRGAGMGATVVVQ